MEYPTTLAPTRNVRQLVLRRDDIRLTGSLAVSMSRVAATVFAQRPGEERFSGEADAAENHENLSHERVASYMCPMIFFTPYAVNMLREAARKLTFTKQGTDALNDANVAFTRNVTVTSTPLGALNLHSEESFIDRNHHREFRTKGMVAWRFKFVMECLPLVMQCSFLCRGCALA